MPVPVGAELLAELFGLHLALSDSPCVTPIILDCLIPTPQVQEAMQLDSWSHYESQTHKPSKKW